MTHAEYLALRRFPALDGLRIVAAAMVVVFHLGGGRWAWLAGWTGVLQFFVLSGFLITTLLLREEAGAGRASLSAFWVRRVFRIMPVYLVVGLAAVGVAAALGGPWWGRMHDLLPWYATLTSEWTTPEELFGQSWTIGIEEKFYLVWPLLAFGSVALVALRRRLALVAGLALVLAAATTVSGGFVHYVVLLVGCALALLLHDPRGWAVLGRLSRAGPASVVGAMFCLAQVAFTPAVELLGTSVAVVVYALPVAALLVSLLGGAPTARALGWAPMRWAGTRSYALYLVAGLVWVGLAQVHPGFLTPRTTTALAVLAAGLLVAEVVHRTVERPCITLGRWLVRGSVHDRRRPRGGAAGREPSGPADTRVQQALD